MDEPIRKLGKTALHVVLGDITRIPVDAIITAINSGGLWYGGIDGAIQRVAGDMYHDQARSKMPLKEGQVVVANGRREQHRGAFNNVVFVVDDLRQPLSRVVYNGLSISSGEGYTSVSLPAIRMGVAAGVVERTPQEAVNKIGLGIAEFMNDFSKSTKLERINFVIYNDARTQRLMETEFSSYSF